MPCRLLSSKSSPSKTTAAQKHPLLCLYLSYHNVHATSLHFQDLVLDWTRDSLRRLPYSNNRSLKAYPTPHSLKSANPTAASVKRRHTHHSLTNRRTEPSPFQDQSRFSRTSTWQRTDRLLRTPSEEPRRTQSARETTTREVLELLLSALLLLPAHQVSESAADTQPPYQQRNFDDYQIEYCCL